MGGGNVSGTTTTSAVNGIVLMICTSLVFLDRLEVSITVSSTGSDVSGTTVTVGVDWSSRNPSGFLGTRARAVNVTYATTTGGDLNEVLGWVKDRNYAKYTYRCMGIMVSPSVFVDLFGRFSVSVGITRRGADVSSATSARVSILRRVR